MYPLNVLGTELLACSYDPLTGFLRDGCCHTDAQDHGTHVICARMTAAFLAFSRAHGVVLSSTHQRALDIVTLAQLQAHAM